MKVAVRNKKTGTVEYVPEHWVNHPVLGRGFQAVNTPPEENAPPETSDGDKPAKTTSKGTKNA